MKSGVIEFTNGGPGVGVTNKETNFRNAERIRTCNIDLFICHHLANDDSSQNEVERCQSYVGDAICDGEIEWEHKVI